MEIKIIAIAPNDGWGFIEKEEKIYLLHPPYTSSNLIEVSRKEVENAIHLHGFEVCDISLNGINEAVKFLKEKYIESKETQGIDLPSSKQLRELLKYATDDVLLEYLNKAKRELIPEGKLDAAESIASELKKLETVRKNPKMLEMIIETLEECNFGIDNPKTLSKYVSLFMNWKLSSREEPEFELAIIEKYLESNPEDMIAVEKRLAEVYTKYDKPEMALEHYLRLLDVIKEKSEILGEILDIYIEKERPEGAMELFKNYSAIIDADVSLRVKKVEVMFKAGKLQEMAGLLNDGGVTERELFDENPSVYFSVVNRLWGSREADKKLNMMLNEALTSGGTERLEKVGTIFYGFDRAEEFKNKIKGQHSHADRIIRKLDMRYEIFVPGEYRGSHFLEST
jgi:tetratricopeptide (TPR) repeat protein